MKCFSDKDQLFDKNLIKKTLPEWLKKQDRWEENRACVEAFDKFTSYFTGFHDNRKNMYVDKPQKTAIAFRLMNENLPRFFNNCLAYEKIRKNHAELVFSIDDEILKKINVAKLSQAFEPDFFLQLFTQSGIDAYNTLLGGITKEDGTKLQGVNEQINLYRQQHDIKRKDMPTLMPLYKQILSERETHSFIPEQFENDLDLLAALRDFADLACGKNDERDPVAKLKAAVEALPESDLDKVYIRTGRTQANKENRKTT